MVKQLIGDRRNATRAKRILSIQFRLTKSRYKDGDTLWHLSTTQDMSIMGLSFLSEVHYYIDDILELHVVMSGILDIYKGYGKVIHVQKKETGVFYLIGVKFFENKALRRKAKTSNLMKGNRIKKTLKDR